MGRGGAQPRQRRAGRWDVNAKIAKSDESVSPFAPQIHTPWGPPSGKTGDFLFIGDVMYRKITSDFTWGCTPFLCPRWRVMSQSSDVSKSLDFQLVVFCEQMGCHFCNFGGVPLQPPVSYPPSANPPKPFGRELEKTVSFQVFTTPGLWSDSSRLGQRCTIRA